MDIGAAVRKLRYDKGISQESLAFSSDISRAYMYKIEARKSSPTIQMLEKIASVLEVKVSDLIQLAETYEN